MTNNQIALLFLGAFTALVATKVITPFIKIRCRNPQMRRFAMQNGYQFIGKASKDEEKALCEYRIGPFFPTNYVSINNYMRKIEIDGTRFIFDIVYAMKTLRSMPNTQITMEPPTTVFLFVPNSEISNSVSMNKNVSAPQYEKEIGKKLWVEERSGTLMIATVGELAPISIINKFDGMWNGYTGLH